MFLSLGTSETIEEEIIIKENVRDNLYRLKNKRTKSKGQQVINLQLDLPETIGAILEDSIEEEWTTHSPSNQAQENIRSATSC